MSSRKLPAPVYRMRVEPLEDRDLLAGNPVITEFMARNVATLDDADGNSSDWVEIYNAGDEPVDLAGYRLTDKSDNPLRWVFPNVTIQPYNYLVVFASSQDTDNFVDRAGNLHTNFALRASGEYLALIDPQGTVLSEFGSTTSDYAAQGRDISYGLAHWVDLIEPDSSAFYKVPFDDSLDATWTSPELDELAAGFQVGTASVGMEDEPRGSINLADDILTELPSRSHGVYTRAHFLLDDARDISHLVLRIKYDNGFIAYLNGHRVESDNAPEVPSWFSKAPEMRPADWDAVVFTSFDLSEHRDKLVEGDNVLAIHGLNHIPHDQGDMLISFQLQAVFPNLTRQGFMPHPTPGTANTAVFDGLVSDTELTLPSGSYDRPQVVEITTATADTDIYYSTDGSYPGPDNTSAFLYQEPLLISETTTIRVAAYRPGFLPSNVITRSFLFVDDVSEQPVMKSLVTQHPVWGPQLRASLLSVPSVSLVTDQPVREGEALGEFEASVEIIHADGTEGFQVDAGFEHFGQWSFVNVAKKNIRISFKAIYGTPRLRYDIFGAGATDEFDQLLLRAGSGDSYVQRHGIYIRNRWVNDTLLAMGHPAPHGRFVHLYINGVYWGMHNLMERPNAAFMASYFGGEKEDYDVIKPGTGSAIDGNLDGWNQLQRVASGNDYDQLEQYLDAVNYADYMLLQFYAGNDDWGPSHNWMAARKRADEGGFKFFPWDSDEVFGSPNTNLVGNGGPAHLWPRVIQFSEFRSLLADRIQKHFFDGGELTPEHVLARFESIADEARLPVIAEAARWTGTGGTGDYTPDVWQQQIDIVRREFIADRTEIVLEQLRRAGLLPTVTAPDVQIGGQRRLDGQIPQQAVIELTSDGATLWYTLDGIDPRAEGGSVSDRAVFYSAPFTATPGQTLKARALDGEEWSPLREVVFHQRSPGGIGSVAQRMPGDANDDSVFDQLDIIQALYGGKFRTGEPADWSEGDWNGDGVFDRMDIVAALQTGGYSHRRYAAE